MPFVITKLYSQGNLLTEAMLDEFKNDTETLLNVTQLDTDSIDTADIALDIANAMSATGANDIAAAMDATGALAVIQKINTTEGYLAQGDSSGDQSYAAPLYSEVNASSGSITVTSSTFTDIGGLTTTITARNRPIMVILQSYSTASSASQGEIVISDSSGSSMSAEFKLLRGSTSLQSMSSCVENTSAFQSISPSAFKFIDLTPGTGSVTYKLQAKIGNGSMVFNTIKLTAVEL